MIETTDVVFAVDSVPAIFGCGPRAVHRVRSNAFAILGLRSLYFCLNGLQDRFRYLNVGLGVILAFVGVKMLLTFSVEQFEWPNDHFHMPTWLSLGVIVLVLTVTILASLRATKKDPPISTAARLAVDRRTRLELGRSLALVGSDRSVERSLVPRPDIGRPRIAGCYLPSSGDPRRGCHQGSGVGRRPRGLRSAHAAQEGRSAVHRAVPLPRGEDAVVLAQRRGRAVELLRLRQVGRRHHVRARDRAPRLRGGRRVARRPVRRAAPLHAAGRGRGPQGAQAARRGDGAGGRVVPRPAAHLARRRPGPQLPAGPGLRRRAGAPVPDRLGARRLGRADARPRPLRDGPEGDRPRLPQQHRPEAGLLPGPHPVPDLRRAGRPGGLRRAQDARRRRARSTSTSPRPGCTRSRRCSTA